MIVLLQGGFVCGLTRGAPSSSRPCSTLGHRRHGGHVRPRRAGRACARRSRLDAGAAARRRALADRPGRRLRCRLARGRGRGAHRAAARGRGGLQRPGGDRAHARARRRRRAAGTSTASSIVWTTAARGSCSAAAVGLVAGLLAARVLGPRWPDARDGAAAGGARGRRSRRSALGALAHGSGFVAVYLYGLVLGDDADLPQADAVRAFGEQLASLAEIAMFVLLGVALAQVPLRGALRRRRAADARARARDPARARLPGAARCSAARTARPCSRRPAGSRARCRSCSRRCPCRRGSTARTRIFALAGLVVLASLALQGPAVARLAPRARASPSVSAVRRDGRASRARRAR